LVNGSKKQTNQTKNIINENKKTMNNNSENSKKYGMRYSEAMSMLEQILGLDSPTTTKGQKPNSSQKDTSRKTKTTKDMTSEDILEITFLKSSKRP
jgi:hypothetical protein